MIGMNQLLSINGAVIINPLLPFCAKIGEYRNFSSICDVINIINTLMSTVNELVLSSVDLLAVCWCRKVWQPSGSLSWLLGIC